MTNAITPEPEPGELIKTIKANGSRLSPNNF
ncbi:hypothetical protein EFREU_v1c00610 [Entomoplasma freundtii]|uniref:Uncharacterized protein n=1 Tax=Entomoplasma freundtii TaxID=74700 RepID=A0A2K8NSF7_9MOLU|nr:hypothetical protein EFREU_v1c00610 [Entomoplasma freundtii]